MPVDGLGEIPKIFSAKNLLQTELRGKKAHLIAPKDTFEMLAPKQKDKYYKWKKAGIAGASWVLPGLGQLINGHIKKSIYLFLIYEFLIQTAKAYKEPGLNVFARALQVYASINAYDKAKVPEWPRGRI